jgi:hypothetical protein
MTKTLDGSCAAGIGIITNYSYVVKAFLVS